jgi:hypothetical protein
MMFHEYQSPRLWWLVDLLPAPRDRKARHYRPPEFLAKVVAVSLLIMICYAVVSLALLEAPHGELIRAVLADVRKTR